MDAPGSGEEVFLSLHVPRHELKPATSFRSTWVVSSQNTLKERGHYDHYTTILTSEHREALTMMVAGAWIPIEVASAHYEACEALALPTAERLAIGRAVSKHLDHTLLSAAVHLATQSGATLWTPLAQFHRFWTRMFVGGGAVIYKLGPKEARIEILGCPMAHIPYFRVGLHGVLLGIGEMFSKRVYLREQRSKTPLTITFRASWV